MGCCQSTSSASPYNDSPRPTNPSSPAANASLPHDSSRAAINQPQRSLTHLDSPRASSTASPHPVRGPAFAPPPPGRPNIPIRPPSPLATSPAHVSHQPPPWSSRQLAKEREAFFDTRVTGSTEVWNALRLVSEMLRQGDLAGAQGVLDAVNASCPNGRVAGGRGRDRLKGGIYDERGQLYDIPGWVLADPEDMTEDEEKDPDAADDGDESADDIVARERRRDEKGKGRAEDIGEEVRVRARLSDRGTDVVATVGTKQKVAVLVRRIQEQAGNKRIRLAYLGKILDEGKTLDQNNWASGHVINALVFEGDEAMLAGKGSK